MLTDFSMTKRPLSGLFYARNPGSTLQARLSF
ncbi:hypothetical protein N172_01575 [Pantoea dispersa EGD-AAK13]|nr:hypothetical protein N172_01575 [Pantoea dispersa EGD-AAK13]KAF0854773.1 hypothetical protein Y788_15645 [Pantoea dispersa 625]